MTDEVLRSKDVYERAQVMDVEITMGAIRRYCSLRRCSAHVGRLELHDIMHHARPYRNTYLGMQIWRSEPVRIDLIVLVRDGQAVLAGIRRPRR